MRYLLCLLTLFLLSVNPVIAQLCNDTLKATANELSPCTKTDLQLYANTITGASYQWTGPDNFYSATQNPQRQNLNILQGGNYILQATVGNCLYADTILIQLRIGPIQATIYPLKAVCDGDSVQLNSFTTGVTTNMFVIDAFNNVYNTQFVTVKMVNGGIYKAFEISTDGCVGDTGYYVATGVPPRPVTPVVSLTRPACEGDSLIFDLKSTDTAVAFHVWSHRRKEDSWIIPSVRITQSGLYRFISVNAIGCVSDTAYFNAYIHKPVIPGVAIYGNADSGPYGTITFTSYVTNAVISPVYRWMKNGVPVEGVNKGTYTAVNGKDILPGDEISLHVTADVTPCPGTGISNILVPSFNLSVNDIQANGLAIYPNPNNGVFTITGIPAGAKEYTLEIINSLGRQVYAYAATGNACQVNAAWLPSGMYTVRLYTDTGVLHQKMTIGH